MLARKFIVIVAAFALASAFASPVMAAGPATPSPSMATSPTSAMPVQPSSAAGRLKALPIDPQSAPQVSVPTSAANQFDGTGSMATLPKVFLKQWSPFHEIPPESFLSEQHIRTAETTAREMSLKQAIYLALKNNPQVKAVRLNPVLATETVRLANGAFDPVLTSQIDVSKDVTPSTSALQTGGTTAYSQKFYDWNFGITKVLSLSNATFGITFNNQRALSNSFFQSINPTYTPTLALSLSQPLLRNFGWKFATINVRIAESGQKQAQWNYEQSVMDFVQKVSADYWNVVLAEQSLAVTRAALKFNQDLVHNNQIAVKVGTLAPLDLQEAQSAAATSEANVATAEANLKTARAQLSQDILYNPNGTFLPAEIQPSQTPSPNQPIRINQEHALELAVQYRPSLASMREAIRAALLEVKFQKNQTLPQLNLSTQFGITSVAGATRCTPKFGNFGPPANCVSNGTPGTELPFKGTYPTALNRLWNFTYYNYAAVLSFQMPLDNASAKAELAQARIQYEQTRMQYRSALSQAVVEVQNAIANLIADKQRAQSTEQATYFAKQALRDEQVRFKVGMATTHDLLQFQQQEVAAEGNQVQAAIDLENAKLNLDHADGTLLQKFDIEFLLQNPRQRPWYAEF